MSVDDLLQKITKKYDVPVITDNPVGKEVLYTYENYGTAIVFTDNTCLLIYEEKLIPPGGTHPKSYMEFWSKKYREAHREFMLEFDEEEYSLYLRLKDKYEC